MFYESDDVIQSRYSSDLSSDGQEDQIYGKNSIERHTERPLEHWDG